MSPLRRIAWAAAALTLLLIAMTSAWYGGRAALGDASVLSARWLISAWRAGRGPAFTPQRWQDARDQLIFTLKITPDNAQLYDDLAYLHAARAQALGITEAGSVLQEYQFKLLDEAIVNYRTATQLRPTFPYSWAYLALAKHLRGVHDAELWRAFDKSLQYGATEPALLGVIAGIAFDQWSYLDTEHRHRVSQMITGASPEACTKALALGKISGAEWVCKGPV